LSVKGDEMSADTNMLVSAKGRHIGVDK
jgi:hypothetical protein